MPQKYSEIDLANVANDARKEGARAVVALLRGAAFVSHVPPIGAIDLQYLVDVRDRLARLDAKNAKAEARKSKPSPSAGQREETET